MLNHRFSVAIFVFWIALASVALNAQEAGKSKQTVAIRAERLIDGKSDAVVKDAVVLVYSCFYDKRIRKSPAARTGQTAARRGFRRRQMR